MDSEQKKFIVKNTIDLERYAMKVIYYIHSLVVGGAETIVTNYLLELKRQGVDVALVVNDKEDTFLQKKIDENDITTHILLKERKKGFIGKMARSCEIRLKNFPKKWKKIIEEENPDIIHIHGSPMLIRNIHFPAHRLVYTFHSEVTRALSMCKKKDRQVLSRWAKEGVSFFCITSKACDGVKTLLSANKVVRIPNGLDLAAIRNNRYDREAFLKTLNIPTNAFIVGHVGRFHPVKNHEKLLSVFGKIAQKKENAYLLLVGTGTEEEVAHVRELSKKYEVEKNTVFLGLREDATKLMSVIDILLLPSISESFSLVLIEAQAQNVRCIASSAIPEEVICNSNCMRLSLDESDDVWAEYAISDIKNQAVKSIEEFDIQTVIRNMCAEYQKIIDAERGEEVAG